MVSDPSICETSTILSIIRFIWSETGFTIKANEKPLDFTYVNRARKQFGQEPYKRLKKDQLVNIYEVTPTRQRYFNDKTVDPVSRFFIWTAIAVSAAVGWKEYKLREDGESLVTVVDKD